MIHTCRSGIDVVVSLTAITIRLTATQNASKVYQIIRFIKQTMEKPSRTGNCACVVLVYVKWARRVCHKTDYFARILGRWQVNVKVTYVSYISLRLLHSTTLSVSGENALLKADELELVRNLDAANKADVCLHNSTRLHEVALASTTLY